MTYTLVISDNALEDNPQRMQGPQPLPRSIQQPEHPKRYLI
jgi:hypothetical protein